MSRRNPKEKKRLINFFKNGIENINENLKVRFSLRIHGSQRYYDYFKLVAYSKDDNEKERIRKTLDVFPRKLKNDMELFDVLWETKNIMDEHLSNLKELYSEVDFEVGFKREISKYLDIIKIVIMIASFVISLIRYLPDFEVVPCIFFKQKIVVS